MNFYSPMQALPIMREASQVLEPVYLVGLRGLVAEITCKRGLT